MNNKRLESIIKAYKILKQQNPDTWILDCSNAKTIEVAIERAATARNNAGRKHDHQLRIPNSVLDSFAVEILEKKNEIKKVQSFDDLISIVDNCRIKGISDLTIYDTAHRIGEFIKKYPDKVYLHRGTRTGAEILLGKIKESYITISQLPQPFQTSNLTAAEIEDVLCIYKDRLRSCV